MRTVSVLACLTILTGCASPQTRPSAAVRPPDLHTSLQSGSIEVIVPTLRQKWTVSGDDGSDANHLKMRSDSYGFLDLTLYPAEKITPFGAVFGAMIFFSERYAGSVLTCDEKKGQAARTTGLLAMPGLPPIRLEVRAWNLPGTETVAVLTGMWPDGPDKTSLQDLEAVVAGTRAVPKKK